MPEGKKPETGGYDALARRMVGSPGAKSEKRRLSIKMPNFLKRVIVHQESVTK
jgi:hypothetical protein